jgi:Zn-finger protein
MTSVETTPRLKYETWACQNCSTNVPIDLWPCINCYYPLLYPELAIDTFEGFGEQKKAMDGWNCTHCKAENLVSSKSCVVCYAPHRKDSKHALSLSLESIKKGEVQEPPFIEVDEETKAEILNPKEG